MSEWVDEYSLFQMARIVSWNSPWEVSSALVEKSPRAKLPLRQHGKKIQNPTTYILLICLFYNWNLKVTANSQQIHCLKELSFMLLENTCIWKREKHFLNKQKYTFSEGAYATETNRGMNPHSFHTLC